MNSRDLTIPARVLASSALAGKQEHGVPAVEVAAERAAGVLEVAGAGHPAVAVAWLASVLQLTDITEAELRAAFGEDIAAGVSALTPVSGEGPVESAARAQSHPLASVVAQAETRAGLRRAA